MNFVVFAEIPEITVFTVFTSFGKVSKSGNFPKYQGLIFGGPGGVRGTRISRSPTRPRWIDQSVACTRITRKPVYQERGIPGFWARGGGGCRELHPAPPAESGKSRNSRNSRNSRIWLFWALPPWTSKYSSEGWNRWFQQEL